MTSQSYLTPIGYIDSLRKGQHVALFFEDSEYAKLLEARFLKNGLAMGEKCIYATEEDSGSIILKLLNYGISLEDFKKRKIQVFQTRAYSGGSDEVLSSYKMQLNQLLSGLEAPFRMVARLVPDVKTLAGISVEIQLEEIFHDCFETFKGSVICPYNLSEIEPRNKREWLMRLRDAHHAIIHVPKFGQGEVIRS